MSAFEKVFGFLAVLAVLLGAFLLGRGCGVRSQEGTVALLSARVAESEKTTELQKGLYATKIVQLSDLQALLDTSQRSVAELRDQLSKSREELLSTQQLVVRWKSAYEGALGAHQTPVPVPGGKDRQRVDFQGSLGPIMATGYTLTDPAEAHLKLDQTEPLILNVSVAKQPDGTWASYVASSDDSVDVRVNLAGVDPGVTSPGWKQRIFLDFGAYPLGSLGASVGVSYHFDRWSLGLSCADLGGDASCGVNVGLQLFR